MSADAWQVCPRCLERVRNEKAVALENAIGAYGAVPVAEYERLKAAAEDMPDAPGESLREDWELGTDETGEFEVAYRCSCGTCGLTFHFRHSEKVPL